MPSNALKNEVAAKYMRVLNAIFPFIRAFRLAEPAIRLEITRGRIISFRIRMKSSPGYDINIIESGPKFSGRRLTPTMKFKGI